MYNYPLFDELRQSMYAVPAPFAELEKGALEGQIKLTDSWKIVNRIADQTVIFACEDLCDFLACHCNLRIATDGKKTTSQYIELRIEPSATPGKAESYCLEIGADKIIVKGYDSSGIMYGVFRLQEMMKQNHAAIVEIGSFKASPVLERRISRSPMAFFQGNEIEYLERAYTDNYLQKMAHCHINGIWIRSHLRDLVQTDIFPELGKNQANNIKEIKKLAAKAEKYGISLFIYSQEPMGIHKDDPFWENNMDIRGHFQKSQSNYAMCTSIQKVKDFIFEISRLLFMELPNLKGLVIISFSEFNSHCHARGETNCERCKNRERDEVIAEVLNLLNAGAKAARTDAEVIAWNWSWGGYQEKIVSRLDETISLMGDYERGGKRSFDGIEHIVDEYSLSYVGPSEQFCEILHDAGRGRKKYAKLQLGVTHEIATVPYFPLMQKIVSKIANMKELGLSGMLECWNFGNILSRNIEVANMMAWDSCDTEPEEILKTLAARDFGKEAAQDFVRSWQTFCDASDHYPFSLRLLYIGPMNHGGAYPLIFEKVNLKTPSSWHLFGEVEYEHDFAAWKTDGWGDDISLLCSEFGVECTLDSFRKLIKKWSEGVEIMLAALKKVPSALINNAESEINVCKAILCQFRSSYNFIYFILLRNLFLDAETVSTKSALLYKLRSIAYEEIDNALELKKYSSKDKSLGFHGEAFGYFYNAEKIDGKIETTKRSILEIEENLTALR